MRKFKRILILIWTEMNRPLNDYEQIELEALLNGEEVLP